MNKYTLNAGDCHGDLQSPRNDNVFTGGWIGFFSYDLNKFIENVPSRKNDDVGLPLIRLCFYDKVICFGHFENCFHIFAIELPGDKKQGQEKIKELEICLAAVANNRSLTVAEGLITAPLQSRLGTLRINRGANGADKQFNSNMTKDYYLDAIDKTKKYIYDGDVYQINFSQRFTADFNSEAYELFLWQNKFNPSPYSAYIDAGNYQIVSASPELFFNINKNKITTCPIKGTRSRMGDEIIDGENYKELIDNEKEKAELDMIIDLERNDLVRQRDLGSRK